MARFRVAWRNKFDRHSQMRGRLDTPGIEAVTCPRAASYLGTMLYDPPSAGG